MANLAYNGSYTDIRPLSEKHYFGFIDPSTFNGGYQTSQ